MSEELGNSVQEMLKEETWTRAAISSFTKNSLMELEEILEKAHTQNCETEIKNICDEKLETSKESLIALYLSGMIGLKTGSLDESHLNTLVEIFENNHKENLIEHLCNSILDFQPSNKFALRNLAKYYKSNNDDKLWDTYALIVKYDPNEADLAKVLAERYEAQMNKDDSIGYYKKALLRYVSAKNYIQVKEIWAKLVSLIPEELDWFLLVQRKIAKTIDADKSATLLMDLYEYYKATAKWDIAISLLKMVLEIDNKDSLARREITECFRQKYADHSHLDDYIRQSNLTASFRNVFEAINDFEKHIAFDAGNYVFHKTWGVGIIRKVEGEVLKIRFAKKKEVNNQPTEIKLAMAVSALQPLPKEHIWVQKAINKKEVLLKKVQDDIPGTLKMIINSFPNACDDKRIKAELVPSILTAGQWTSWHSKAQQVLATDGTFGVNPNDINIYIVRDHEISMSERLSNEFKAEKKFFARIDVAERLCKVIDGDTSDELFLDMLSYFAGHLKAINKVTPEVVASFLFLQKVNYNMVMEIDGSLTFANIYSEIDNPKEIYRELKDTKNTTLRKNFIQQVRLLADWDAQYARLFPEVLDIQMLNELRNNKPERLTRLVQDSFTDYKNNRDSAIFMFKECRNQEWFKDAGVSYEKQLITLVNIIDLCYKEISNHVNSTENKKTIKNATTLLFEEKTDSGKKNNMQDYILSLDKEQIRPLYTLVNDVAELEHTFKSQLRNAILDAHPDFKFQETEIKQEAPKGLQVTQAKLVEKEAEVADIENRQLPEVIQEVSEAREKGDLSENAEYTSAKEKRDRLNAMLKKLKEEISTAQVFNPQNVTTAYVSFGTKVKFHDNNTNEDVTYTMLGPWESNIDEGIISYRAPLGDALLNAKVGDNRKFEVNGRQYDFTVLEIKSAY